MVVVRVTDIRYSVDSLKTVFCSVEKHAGQEAGAPNENIVQNYLNVMFLSF